MPDYKPQEPVQTLFYKTIKHNFTLVRYAGMVKLRAIHHAVSEGSDEVVVNFMVSALCMQNSAAS